MSNLPKKYKQSLKLRYKFTVSETAKYLSVSANTLRNWEETGKLIPLRTKGNSRRYTLSGLNNFLSTQTPIFRKIVETKPSALPPGNSFKWKMAFLSFVVSSIFFGTAGLFLPASPAGGPVKNFTPIKSELVTTPPPHSR